MQSECKSNRGWCKRPKWGYGEKCGKEMKTGLRDRIINKKIGRIKKTIVIKLM
jgi:hypothetical protein